MKFYQKMIESLSKRKKNPTKSMYKEEKRHEVEEKRNYTYTYVFFLLYRK